MSTLNEMDQPDFRCPAAVSMAVSLEIVRDLAGGTPQMRKKAEKYLPKEPGEKEKSYRVRLARSLLFNTFVKVREGLVGMAFKENPVLGDDVPLQIKQHLEDIDLAGSHIDVFAKELFEDIVNDGHAFIFVDMPQRLTASVTSAAATPDAYDEQVAGQRPFWVKYKKDQAINWTSDRINGETVLTQITFEECATEKAGRYGQREVTRYRTLTLPLITPASPGKPAVYGPMVWSLHEKNEKDEIVAVDGDVTDLDRIPVVCIYSRRTGYLESEPPLIDLAHLNVGHWQQWSDINNQIRMLTPILVRKRVVKPASEGEDRPQEEIQLGPGTVVDLDDKDAELKYVSHDGTAIDTARESLMDLEQRMSAVGLSLIAAKQDKVVTLGEKVMDQGERTSELSTWVRGLTDGIEQALGFHAGYMGLPDGGSISMTVTVADASAFLGVVESTAPPTEQPKAA